MLKMEVMVSELILLSIIFFQLILYKASEKIVGLIGYRKLLGIMIALGCLAPLPGWMVDKNYLDKNAITVPLSISIWIIMIVIFLIIDRRFRYKKG